MSSKVEVLMQQDRKKAGLHIKTKEAEVVVSLNKAEALELLKTLFRTTRQMETD